MKYYTGVGARDIPDEYWNQLYTIATVFANAGWTLRSGGAAGSDLAFERGALSRNGKMEIYVVDKLEDYYIDATKLDNFSEAEYIVRNILSKGHWNRLSRYGKLLHTRNVYQVLGRDLNTPSDLVICYTEDGKMKGGTATAIKMAMSRGIEVVNIGDPNFKRNMIEYE